jgi:2-phosphosulfolactate phosphatase
MKIEKLARAESHLAEDLAVVIDVIRAFTTAACAFERGAKKIILVSSVEDAFQTHKLYPGSIIMGEVGGAPVAGFHLSNSPHEILQANLLGKTLVQRTSSGTQGVTQAKNAKVILAASFVVAESTVQRIRELNPEKVSFIITGTKDGSEDLALADYLEEKLKMKEVNPVPFLKRVMESPDAQEFINGNYSFLPMEDLDIVCDVDRYHFSMQVFRENGYHILRKV